MPKKGLWCTDYFLSLHGEAQKNYAFLISGNCVVVGHLLHSTAACPEHTDDLRVGLFVDFLLIIM